LIITRATDYAIRTILFLAKQPPGEIVLKRDICRTQDITPAFLTKILQPLIKAGFIGSQRGVGGGFYLLRNPAEITLLDIVRAEEGPIHLNQCLSRPGFCERDALCPVHGAWREICDELNQTLARYSFADLLKKERQIAGTPQMLEGAHTSASFPNQK
jgi:Rrf2 family protein